MGGEAAYKLACRYVVGEVLPEAPQYLTLAREIWDVAQEAEKDMQARADRLPPADVPDALKAKVLFQALKEKDLVIVPEASRPPTPAQGQVDPVGVVLGKIIDALRDEQLWLHKKAGVRPAVAWFAHRMEAGLREHDAERGPMGWKGDDLDSLLGRCEDETRELDRAIDDEDKEAIIEEASDLANFCMMIAHNAAGNPEPVVEKPDEGCSGCMGHTMHHTPPCNRTPNTTCPDDLAGALAREKEFSQEYYNQASEGWTKFREAERDLATEREKIAQGEGGLRGRVLDALEHEQCICQGLDIVYHKHRRNEKERGCARCSCKGYYPILAVGRLKEALVPPEPEGEEA
jgi:NTP pyrophosphatase (non-canonical NTP hydrolase)